MLVSRKQEKLENSPGDQKPKNLQYVRKKRACIGGKIL